MIILNLWGLLMVYLIGDMSFISKFILFSSIFIFHYFFIKDHKTTWPPEQADDYQP